MLKTFESLVKNVKLKPKNVSIDNLVFQLHYRVTFLLLLVCTVLVTSRQYIGEHIRCINDKGVETRVLETFCFFTSTYTVVRHLDPSSVLSGAPLPGVGPELEGEPIIRHAYYQWVPFVLFLQAFAFYVPHWIWRMKEAGRLKLIVNLFEYAALSSSDDVTVNGVTKCTFYKYGPSGSLQKHDAMCVMALNIINEKIYVVLWFWFVILAVATVLALLWRIFTFFFHSRSNAFNRRAFRVSSPQQVEPYEMITVTRHCNYSDWLFLYYLADNLDGFVFQEIFVGLAHDFDDASAQPVNDEKVPADEEKIPLQ